MTSGDKPRKSNPGGEPDRLSILEEQHDGIAELLGKHPSDGDPGGSGMAGSLARMEKTLGKSPDAATGEKGYGLCRTVAELSGQQPARNSKKALAAATTVGMGAAAVIAELIKAFG